jgi:hypothetical protein
MHSAPAPYRSTPVRAAVLAAMTIALAASLAWGDPAVRVSYPSGVTRIELEGSWSGSAYRVSRAASPDGPASTITALDTPCLGPCFADDPTAEPGRTYWYRFELVLPDGSSARFGPYSVTVSNAAWGRLGAAAYPNPARGYQSVELFVGGRSSDAPVAARVDIFDLSGRRVRALFSGLIPVGATRIGWDGADDAGRRVRPGAYVMQFATPLGVRASRLLRID